MMLKMLMDLNQLLRLYTDTSKYFKRTKQIIFN
jgi:hypothetical protein